MLGLGYNGPLHVYQTVANTTDTKLVIGVDGTNGCMLCFRVRSFDQNATPGCWSAEARFEVPKLGPPATCTGVRATSIADTSLNVSRIAR